MAERDERGRVDLTAVDYIDPRGGRRRLWDRAHTNCRVGLGDYPACASWPGSKGSLSLRNPVECVDYTGLRCHEDFTGVRGADFRLPGGSGNVVVVAWRIAYVLENGCHAYSPIDFRCVYRPPCGDAVVTDDYTYAQASNTAPTPSTSPSYYYNSLFTASGSELTFYDAQATHFAGLDVTAEVTLDCTGLLSDTTSAYSVPFDYRLGTNFFRFYWTGFDGDDGWVHDGAVEADPYFAFGGSPAWWFQQEFRHYFGASLQVTAGSKSTTAFRYNDPTVSGSVFSTLGASQRTDGGAALCSETPTFGAYPDAASGYGVASADIDGGTIDCDESTDLSGVDNANTNSRDLRTGQSDPCAFGGFTEVTSTVEVTSAIITVTP